MPHRWSNVAMDVRLVSGSLYSATELSVLSGANLAAIRGSGAEEWEIFQFRDAELNPDGSYKLNQLLRGQFGTDSYIPELHPIDSEVIILDTKMGQFEALTADLGTSKTVRYGPSNLALSNSNYQEESLHLRGVGLRPFSPAHLRSAIHIDGSVSFNWVRRTRAVGDYWASQEVPLEENGEHYLVSIFKQGVVLRETETSAPRFFYSTTDQAQDDATGAIDIEVSQISQIFGSGPSTRISINV
jgi:hypothetical protein